MTFEQYIATEEKSSESRSVLEEFGNGLWNAVKSPYDGLRQLAGADVDASSHDAHSFSETAGKFAGTAALFLGANCLARRIPGLTQIAPVAAGATLGFVTPTKDGSMADRLANTVTGAGTSALLEFGPGLISAQRSFGSMALTNLAAGALQVQADSLIKKGSAASFSETTAAAGSWFLTGAMFHAAGSVFGKSRDSARNQPTAEPATTVEQFGPNDFRVRMGTRLYDVHTPAGIDFKNSTPLKAMISLDGVAPKSIGNMARETQFNGYSDRSGDTVVIYPYAQEKSLCKLGPLRFGKAFSWNVPETGLTGYNPKLQNDMQFLDRVIADAGKRFNLDSKAISAVGFSEGGMLLHSYAAQRPGQFATIASVHGTVNGREAEFMAQSANHPRVLIIHSDADRVLKYQGGSSIFTCLLENASKSKPHAQAALWTRAHGAQDMVVAETPVLNRVDFLKTDGTTAVAQIQIKGGGHAWDGSPTGGSALFGRPLPKSVFSTSDAVWNFAREAPLAKTSVPVETAAAAKAGTF